MKRRKKYYVPLLAAMFTMLCTSSSIDYTTNPTDGHLTSIQEDGIRVTFRDTSFIGPAFDGVKMQSDGKGGYVGEKGQLKYTMQYKPEKDNLMVICSITNTDKEKPYVTPLRESLVLGVDCEMINYPQWDTVVFPTLVRCEKDYCWGYFGSTQGHAMVMVTEDPVASYRLNYEHEGDKAVLWGHRIYTATLDLLHCPPLPGRHPQNLDKLAAGETRTWRIHLGVAKTMDDVQATIARWTNIPMIHCSRYTVGEKENIQAQILTTSPQKAVATLTSPSGKTEQVKFDKTGNATLGNWGEKGLYTLRVKEHGHTSEASIFVRQPWKWYLDAVRRFQVEKSLPIMGPSAEQFYGYYPAFKAARTEPDPMTDDMLRERFMSHLPAILDTTTWVPLPDAYPHRVQNWSTVTSMLVDLYNATGKVEYLKKAGKMGDYVLTHQVADGSYRKGKEHYTCVIYPAKSILDLAIAEQEAGLTEDAKRHRESAMRACEELRTHLDNIGTEGEMTFEDGMITCSALQLAYAGLQCQDQTERQAFADAAEKMMAKHRCLEQNIIPDCRMHGATERYWEALDIYFTPNQVMNSPHGWTGWKLFAVLYLYQLTGKECYLNDFLDTMGSCAQLVELSSGKLRWGFMPDPYIDGHICVPGDKPYTRTFIDYVVGEQYMDMITPWCRQEDESKVGTWYDVGCAGDGTVYELFNVMGEACEKLHLTD